MKKARILSFLLSLTMLVSAAVPSTMALPVYADEAETDKGLEISKTAKKNDDGSYTITLEAYATGKKISTEVTKDVPTDIVLVLDQSGSMDQDMNTYGFRAYTNKSNNNYYNLRHNGGRTPNLYYKLEDGSYATVSVERTQNSSYTECPASWPNGASWGNDNYYSNRYNLYVKVGEEYQKVELSRSGGIVRGYTYTYTFPDGSRVVSSGEATSPGGFNGKGPLYVRNTTQEYSYTYSYTDKEGVNHVIGTSEGNGTRPIDFTLYERYSTGSVSRLDALKTAVTSFKNSVATKAAGKDGRLGTSDDIDHRVAVVGFASESGYGNNTELLSISGSNSGSVGVSYNNITDQTLKDVLQSMKTQGGQNMVISAINALTANGATRADLGMDMAQRILNVNPVPEGEKRNRVVVFFTDGQPTSGNSFEKKIAELAIDKATGIKTAGASVYAVGIFDGADATSTGTADGNNTEKSNWFMQNVSSNNGTPQTPSYYLSASDADTLNSIFQQISDNIQEGGSDINLGSEAVIKDIISPQFQLPAGATEKNITLETWKYTGENQWENNNDALNATATVNGAQVSVTGFDFKENWCGTETNNGVTTYRGNKLVISFKVEVKDGFLGGNGVYTNADAGVYKNNTANNPLFTFERPQVGVPIEPVTVTAEDKNVYLMGDLTAEQIKSGATVEVGDVELELGKENYGLQSWQNEYVNITVTYQDKEGNLITDLNDLKEDTTYTVSVEVSPKNPGTVERQTGTGTGNINVYTPELTYKDGNVYYGDDFLTNEELAENLVSVKWVHDTTEADAETMGAAPKLIFQYKPESGVDDNKVNTKQDIRVSVDVRVEGMAADTESLNDFITFKHQACDPACGWTDPVQNNGNPAFLIHVKTCQLTVTKEGGAEKEPYVFDIMKDGEKYTEVTIVGNNSEIIYELPVGKYSIEEKQGWSWRYLANNGSKVELSSANTSDGITCTNTHNNDSWLNGYSDVVKNIANGKSSGNNN